MGRSTRSRLRLSMMKQGSFPMESLRISMHRSTADSFRAKLSPVSVPAAGYPASTSISAVSPFCAEGDRATARSPLDTLTGHRLLPAH